MIRDVNRYSRPPCGLSAAAALGLGRGASAAYDAWVADGRPWVDARPVRAVGDRLAEHGYTVYYHGDERHLTNVPPEDHTPFSATGWPGPHPYPYCLATDIMPPKAGQVSKLTGRPLPTLDRLAVTLRTDRINNNPGAAWLKYMNWTDETGLVWHDRWQPGYARSPSSDTGHIHLSGRTDYATSATADGYDLVARTEGDDVTIFGWDASHYDAVPNGATVVAEGFKFMTHKAGGDANDAELGSWWAAMKPYRDRVLLGAYWVLYPGNPQGRADAFLARLDSQCPGWRDGPFILQADAEIWGGDTSTKPSKAEIEAFCDRLAGAMPKLRPVAYAPKWVYGDSLAGLSYPLWASSYVTGTGTAAGLYPGDSSSRWAAYSGQTPAILQFTSSATIAGQTTCDANAYRGSLAQLTALLAPGWETEDMTFEADQVPVHYPTTNPANPTVGGPWALGSARDLAQENRDLIKALTNTVTLNQKAILTAVQGVNEEAVLAAVREESAKIQAKADALARQEAERDTQNLQALLAALPQGSDPVTRAELDDVLRGIYGDVFLRAAQAMTPDEEG
jgi:hypothetical protein